MHLTPNNYGFDIIYFLTPTLTLLRARDPGIDKKVD